MTISRILHLDGKNYATMGDELIATDPVNGAVLWKQSLRGDLHNLVFKMVTAIFRTRCHCQPKAKDL